MRVLSKYILELHWKSVIYNSDEVAVLKGAYFSGPVLQDAMRLEEEDKLTLDMTKQHEVFAAMDDYYQAVLNWKGVDYKGDKIILKEAWIKGRYVNSLETLKDTDWVLIDCTAHDIKKYEGKQGKRIAPGIYETRFNHPLIYWAKIHKNDKERKF